MKNLFLTLKVVIIFTGVSYATFAQTHSHHTDKHNIGIGLGVIPKHHDEIIIPVIHACWSYNLTDVFDAGLSLGLHFTDDKIYSFAAKAGLDLIRGFYAELGLGSAWQSDVWSFMAAVELGYHFQVGRFGLGPFAELSYHHKHEHFSLGISTSIPF